MNKVRQLDYIIKLTPTPDTSALHPPPPVVGAVWGV